MKRNPIRLGALLVVAVLVLAACGGGEAETTTTSPADNGGTATEAPATSAPADTGTATTAAPATTMAPGDDTTAGAVIELLISAEDSEGFSVSKLEAPAGQEISVTFDNKDGGAEPHNWHVVIEAGSIEYATLIHGGPDSQTVTFTVDAPGEYKYFCDTHPIAMTGTLIVTP
jgi:plastocyanin